MDKRDRFYSKDIVDISFGEFGMFGVVAIIGNPAANL
jgi:hypothetical protein